MQLGDKLYKLRTSKKQSHEELALQLNVSKTALIKWESNKAKPSIDNLMKICDYFETDVYSLLEEVSNINFSNAQFKGHSYAAFAQNFTVNNNITPDLLKLIFENQTKLNNLFEKQNDLFEQLLKKR